MGKSKLKFKKYLATSLLILLVVAIIGLIKIGNFDKLAGKVKIADAHLSNVKAKLNANMKKRNVLRKLWEAAMITVDAIDEEWNKIDNMIAFDLNGLRKYNTEYLNHLDEFGYEIQEETEEPGCED